MHKIKEGDTEKSPFNVGEEFRGIKLLMSYEEVINILGEPVEHSTYISETEGQIDELVYNDFRLEFVGRLVRILIDKSNECNNVTENQLPLEEAEIINLMNEKMDIEDIQDWNMVKNGEIFTFSYVPKDTSVEGISYSVNSKTGTVYEDISGAPQTNLAVKNSLNFTDITNGSIYHSEIYKLANSFIESNNLLPIPSKDNWIEGGYGDGYLYGEVKNGDREFSIKFDVFTKEWEEIENLF